MKPNGNRPRRAALLAALASQVAIVVVACSPTVPPEPQITPDTTSEVSEPAGRWAELLSMAPYPYTTPLPPPIPTSLDGTYVKIDPRPGERAGCRRCPPYPPEGGLWKLRLEKGTFRVYHERTGWRSLGSFVVEGDRISVFNDPQCIDVVGQYVWKLDTGQLSLQVVEDACGPDLRAKNFASQPWLSCQPPSTEAAVTDHWPAPPGCSSDSLIPKE